MVSLMCVRLNFSLHTPARPGFIPLFVFRLKKVSLRFRAIFQNFDFFWGEAIELYRKVLNTKIRTLLGKTNSFGT